MIVARRSDARPRGSRSVVSARAGVGRDPKGLLFWLRSASDLSARSSRSGANAAPRGPDPGLSGSSQRCSRSPAEGRPRTVRLRVREDRPPESVAVQPRAAELVPRASPVLLAAAEDACPAAEAGWTWERAVIRPTAATTIASPSMLVPPRIQSAFRPALVLLWYQAASNAAASSRSVS